MVNFSENNKEKIELKEIKVEKTKEEIVATLRTLTSHQHVALTSRGNTAITTALSILPKDKTVLIPEEGGWLHYRIGPRKLKLKTEEVRCQEAVIDLQDLHEKLINLKPAAFIYQNPGGYFAEQPCKEIYELCKKNSCLVILDVSGAIGTDFCRGKEADIMVCSFGEDKLINAGFGGFISCRELKSWELLKNVIEPAEDILNDETKLELILEKIKQLPQRITFLLKKRRQIVANLGAMEIVHPEVNGFVVVIKYGLENEKEKIINYCHKDNLPFTECPRYLRLKEKAISIEFKQLIR